MFNWDATVVNMILKGIAETLYMTCVSTIFGYVLGLPLGVLCAVSDKEGIRPNQPLYRVLDIVINMMSGS